MGNERSGLDAIMRMPRYACAGFSLLLGTNKVVRRLSDSMPHSCLVRQILTIHRHFSSLSTASKVPVRALFLGRGASDQLVGAMAVSVHWGMYHRELFPRLVEGSWDGKTRHISTTGIHSSAITASGDTFSTYLLPVCKLQPIGWLLCCFTWDSVFNPAMSPCPLLYLNPKVLDHLTMLSTTDTGLGSSTLYDKKMHEEIKELLQSVKDYFNQTSSYLAMYRLPRTLVHILSFACCHSSGSYYGNRGSLYLGLRRRRWQIRPWPWSGMVLAEEGQVWNWGGEDDEGQVLSWGFDGHCQLGHSSIQCQKIPAVIDALADQHAIHVTCGGFIVGSYNCDPSKLPKWNHDGSQFYCSAGTNARHEFIAPFPELKVCMRQIHEIDCCLVENGGN
ncbi:hypothetical protein D5086_004318 [Populus alba]|uniref:Uncharacterized protein n=1 Tax=Populus alba TaxID=43335 RepID=A0ACC4CQ48_POPAL